MRVTTFGAQSMSESTIKTYEEFPLDRTYLEARSMEMLGLLRRGAMGDKGGGVRVLERIRELGERLYCELVPPSIRGKVAAASGGELLLSIEKNLIHLPWELLHDGTGFLCRRYDLGRIVSVPPSLRRRGRADRVCPVTVLSVADPSGDLPEAGREALAVMRILLDRCEFTRPLLLCHRVKSADFLDGLDRCDVLHYAGHVDTDGNEPGLRFVDGACTAERVAHAGGGRSFPCLVFLNGCRSAAAGTGAAISEDEIRAGPERAFAMGSAFLLSGARIFIGTLWNVQDEAAARAGVAFFRALSSGLPVGAALTAVREELARLFGESTPAWAGYVLYGDPAFRLVEAPWQVDRLLERLDMVERARGEARSALSSSDPVERFTAAVLLSRMGEQSREALLGEGETLLHLLEHGDPVMRRLGERLCRMLTGDGFGYEAEGDEAVRAEAVARVREWWISRGGHADE